MESLSDVAVCTNGIFGVVNEDRRGRLVERSLRILSMLSGWFYGGTVREILYEINDETGEALCQRTITRDLKSLHSLGLITRETCPATRVVRYRINKNSPLVTKLFGKVVTRG